MLNGWSGVTLKTDVLMAIDGAVRFAKKHRRDKRRPYVGVEKWCRGKSKETKMKHVISVLFSLLPTPKGILIEIKSTIETEI